MGKKTASYVISVVCIFVFTISSAFAAQRDIISRADDVYQASLFKSSIFVNLSTGAVSYGGSATAETVTVTGNKSGLTLSSSLSDELLVTLSGSLHGTFTVDSTKAGYAVELSDAVISATDGPALNLLSKERCFLICGPDSKNILTDSVDRISNTKKSALYAKGPLVLAGAATESCSNTSVDEFSVHDTSFSSGTLTVNGGYKHGIYSDDYIRVTGGSWSVNCTARDCIRSVNGFIMDSGKITLKGTGSVTDEESKGIKIEGGESSKTPGEGFIVINGGIITVNTVSKGITAGWKIDEDAETETEDDDPNPYVLINGGLITVTTTGKPYEYTAENGTTVSNSPEGIEGKADVIINSGTITIRTADDCINAGNDVIINGGSIDVISTENDAIDANGSICFNGGIISATGGSDPECAFDCDFSSFEINGGIIIGTGGSNLTSPASSSKQPVFVWYGSAAEGSVLTVKDSVGKILLTHTVRGLTAAAVISLPEFRLGETYTVSITTGESVTPTTVITTVGSQNKVFRPFGGNDGFGRGNMQPPAGFENSGSGTPPDFPKW